MLGAILGDMVGSPFEFDHNNYKHKDFPLLSEKSHFTDDTVMTVAVARGLMAGQGNAQKTFAEVLHRPKLYLKNGGSYRKSSKTPACVLCAKHSTWAGAVLLWFVRTVRTGRNIIFVEFRPADTGYRDGRFPLLPAPAWRVQRGCADGGTLPAAHPCSETVYPR